jgi:ADP-heptose:LPS heptosyltransferase
MSAPAKPASAPSPREALIAAVRGGAIRRVLAVRFARLGDIVFTLPALEVLREGLPDARIDYLTSGAGRDLVAPHPAISEVLRFEAGWHQPGKRARRSRLVQELKAGRYDLMLVFESDRPTRELLARLAGEAGIPHVVSRSRFEAPPDDPPAHHSCEKHLRLLTMLGLPPEPRPYALHVGEQDRARVDRWLAERGHGGEGAPPLVGLQAGCHYSRVPAWLLRRIGLRHKFHKAWPYPRWSAVGQLLADGLGARVVLTGAAGERRIAEGIAAGIRVPAGLAPLVAAGETTVGMLAALIERTELFLSIDTGTMHMASALGVPTVALFGPTDPGHHGPFGAPATTRLLRSGAPCSPCKKPVRKACRANVCMTDLTPEQVVAAGRALLDGS